MEFPTLPITPLDSAALAAPLPGQAGSGHAEEPTGQGDPPMLVPTSPRLLLGCLTDAHSPSLSFPCLSLPAAHTRTPSTLEQRATTLPQVTLLL